eukprot:3537716-Rhodomonas_salina.1
MEVPRRLRRGGGASCQTIVVRGINVGATRALQPIETLLGATEHAVAGNVECASADLDVAVREKERGLALQTEPERSVGVEHNRPGLKVELDRAVGERHLCT